MCSPFLTGSLSPESQGRTASALVTALLVVATEHVSAQTHPFREFATICLSTGRSFRGRMEPHSCSDCVLTLKWSEGTPQSILSLLPTPPRTPSALKLPGNQEQALGEARGLRPMSPCHALSPPGPGPCQEGGAGPGGSKRSTCDEIAELRIEAHVIVCAVQPDHTELTGDVLRHGHVVHSREEGGRLIVHVQHCKQKGHTRLGLATTADAQDHAAENFQGGHGLQVTSVSVLTGYGSRGPVW